MLKKIIYTLASLSLVALATNAFGTSRASLFLTGEIDLITNLFVNPVIGGATSLDIVAGETARLIATVDEESNNAAGYRIDMESVNAGNLQSAGGSNVPYTISYDAAPPIAPGAVGTPAVAKTTGALTGLTTATSNVSITFAAAPATSPAGAYTDTLIFTMVAL